MVTEEEKQEIISLAVEKTLLMIPDVVGNLMASHASMTKINSAFYAKYPEFKDHKDIVVSVVEMIEGQDPTLDHQAIMNKAVPEIQNRISIVAKMDLKNVTPNANRDFSSHGDL
jgi:hypothetical protein